MRVSKDHNQWEYAQRGDDDDDDDGPRSSARRVCVCVCVCGNHMQNAKHAKLLYSPFRDFVGEI